MRSALSVRHIWLAFALFLSSIVSGRVQTVSTVATFNNLGVTVQWVVPPPPDTTVAMYVRESSSQAPYREVQPLVRISDTAFAGSAFQLAPGRDYDLKLASAVFDMDQFVVATTRPDDFPQALGTTYHVAVAGADDQSGLSLDEAFATLGRALSAAMPGDTVVLHEGRYLEGDLQAPRSGTSSNPIVICSAPGESPILDGTDPDFVPDWTLVDEGNRLYRSPCTVQPANAYLDSEHLFHYLNLEDLRTNRWSQGSGFYADGGHLYIRLADGASPDLHAITLPRFTTGITLSQRSHIQMRGITFCYFGYGTYHRGIYIDGGDFNLIDDCQFHHNGVGVALKRAADFNTIQHCAFNESPMTSWSWHAVKEGGVGYEAGGVVVYSSNEPNQGNVIRFNSFTNHFDGSNLGSSDLDGPTTNLDFHDNFVSGCQDDGLELDGAGINNRVYRNHFEEFLTGISVAPSAIGPTYIFRNVLSGWRSVEEYSGYPFKFNVSSPLSTRWVYLYHNTCYTDVPGQHGFLFKQYSQWSDVISRNNIYAGTDYALDSWSDTNPVDFDYDNLYTSATDRFTRWAGARYATLAELAAATGQETHGLSVAPDFADVASGNFLLTNGSPLVDRGQVLPGVNDDYLGAAPDLGAYESGAAATHIESDGARVLTQWRVAVGAQYQFQFTPALSPADWTDRGEPVRMDLPWIEFQEPVSLDSARFYRLKQLFP